MEQYTKLGIEIFSIGEHLINAPHWAKNIEDGSLTKTLVSAGGNNYYSFPLSSLDAIELASDCAAYADPTPIDELRLAEVLQIDDDGTSLYEEFYE